MIHTVKDSGIVNKAEVDVFLELSSFFQYPAFLMMYSAYKLNIQGDNIQPFSETLLIFDDPGDFGSLISGSSAFSKTQLNIWKFMAHTLLKPGLENFEHYFTSM